MQPASKRFVFVFGGVDDDYKTKDVRFERVLRLDTLKLGKGWDSIDIPNPSLANGSYYGVFPLCFKNEKFEFLIFGGYSTNDVMGRTCIFRTSLSNFFQSEFIKLDQDLFKPDAFSSNDFIPLS